MRFRSSVPWILGAALLATMPASTQQTSIGTTVTQAEIETIPIARDPWLILRQVPGVLIDRINVAPDTLGVDYNYLGQQLSTDPDVTHADYFDYFAGEPGDTAGRIGAVLGGPFSFNQDRQRAYTQEFPGGIEFEAERPTGTPFTTESTDAYLDFSLTFNRRLANRWQLFGDRSPGSGAGERFGGAFETTPGSSLTTNGFDTREPFGVRPPVISPLPASQAQLEPDGNIFAPTPGQTLNLGSGSTSTTESIKDTLTTGNALSDLSPTYRLSYSSGLTPRLGATLDFDPYALSLRGDYGAAAPLGDATARLRDALRDGPTATPWNASGSTEISRLDRLDDAEIFSSNFYLNGLASYVGSGFDLGPGTNPRQLPIDPRSTWTFAGPSNLITAPGTPATGVGAVTPTLPGIGSDPTPFLGGLNLDNGFYALPGSSGPINVSAGGNRASDDYQLFITIYVNMGPGGPSGGTAAPTQRLGQIESAPTWMGRLARDARDWLWTLLARPGAHAAASLAQARRETTLAPGTLVRLAPSSAGQAGSGAPQLSVVANGNSSGEAFELQVLSPTGETTQIVAPDGLVLQAVRRGAGEALRATAGQTLQRASMTGFCLEYEKPPPPADTIYQVAPQDLQQRYGPMRSVLRAGRALAEAGGLNPDSNPLAYATSIQQWALWTRLEDWTLQEFTDEFVEYTKKQVEGAGTRWTDQMRDLLRNAAPNRFNDVTTVLAEADRLARAGAD